MSVTCPQGHASDSTDYCDTCGEPIAAAGSATPSGAAPSPGPASGGSAAPAAPSAPPSGLALDPPAAATKACPNCGFQAAEASLFCEDCGYDFTTGSLPPPPAPVPVASPDLPDAAAGGAPDGIPAHQGAVEWVAEVWVDPDWYATQEADEPCPSAGLPTVVPLHGRSLLVGRHSASRTITPQVDCGADSGVSRRHAQLTTDGQRWWVEDLQSANGTYVGAASGGLPTDPVPPGQRRELAEDERVYLGAWTRIVLRRATPDDSFA